MKTKNLIIILIASMAFFIASCDKTNNPVIVIEELGEADNQGNPHTVKIGEDLHIEAEITADRGIHEITVELHLEGGVAGDWGLDTTYTKFDGLKNTDFHEHVDIDASAKAGDYHFHLEVKDEEGFTTVEERELKISN